ncbi:hypothetical protein [Candidatus Kuenenia stuttgartiensis]
MSEMALKDGDLIEFGGRRANGAIPYKNG